MTGSRVVWNPEFLAVDEGVRALLEGVGAELVPVAQELAPRKTGDLGDSVTYEVEVEETPTGPRLIGKLFATDFKAPWMEFGTVLDVAHPFLSIAVLQVIGNLE